MLRHRALCALLLVAVAATVAPVARAGQTSITAWTDEADALGEGNANWHSLAIMHQAMHDAVNAADPRYARWFPPEADEPPGAGALPEAAAEAAGAAALTGLHPEKRGAVQSLFTDRLAALPAGPARDAGVALGTAIGRAAVSRRRGDGFEDAYLFPGGDQPGVWRPTPPRHQSSGTTRTRPFLFPERANLPFLPPPPPGSEAYLRDVDVARRFGGAASIDRTERQTEAAIFWAYQSTQRGYVHLGATLIDASQDHLRLADQAHMMSQLTAAMADSAILVWAAKEHWAYWRPVDAIRSGAFGVSPDPAWSSFIETPPHPEYPSGHAADCYTGAAILRAFFAATPVTYTAQSAPSTASRPSAVWSSDMGSPPPPIEFMPTPRLFPTVDATAQECADSRIWAGAHFRSANEESRRLAAIIAARALAAVPALPR